MKTFQNFQKRYFLCNTSTISHINYWDQVNSCQNLWKFWNDPLCRNKSAPFPLLNVAGYWNSSNTKAYSKKLSKIHTCRQHWSWWGMGRGGGRVGDWSHNLYEVLKMPASEFMDNPHSCCPIFPALLVCRTRGEGGFTEALVFFYYYLKPLYWNYCYLFVVRFYEYFLT